MDLRADSIDGYRGSGDIVGVIVTGVVDYDDWTSGTGRFGMVPNTDGRKVFGHPGAHILDRILETRVVGGTEAREDKGVQKRPHQLHTDRLSVS